jgi:Apea-like HEPN
METILAACPEEKREWLAETLQYSNHATFRQQLRNFVTQTNAVLRPLLGKNSDKRGEFSEVVYNTRNYLTHHTKELAPKAASGVELFYITRCLSLALQVCLMKELGFAPPKLTETMQKHEHYQHISFLQPQVDLEKLAS